MYNHTKALKSIYTLLPIRSQLLSEPCITKLLHNFLIYKLNLQ